MKKYILINIDNIAINGNEFTTIGSRLGYSIIEIDEINYDLYFNSCKHLVLEKKEAIAGNKYWGEIRADRSDYEIVNELTVKTKIAVSIETLQFAVDFMKKVGQFALTDIIDSRYNIVRSKYSEFEVSTWNIQIEESINYLNNSEAKTPLLTTLSESKGITVSELATRVIQKSTEYRNQISNLLVIQQTVTKKLKECSTIKELNKFYEDYFGIEMPQQQAIKEGLSDENGTRTYPFEYGIKF